MIDALIAGRIHGTPTQRQSANGNAFVVAKVRVTARDGEAYFVNVLAITSRVDDKR